jgi:dTDP-4-amino-4,6-dideoxygalactose transaminase
VAGRILCKKFERRERHMINFNEPPYTGKELEYMKQAVENLKICGDGPFTKKCNQWLEEKFGAQKVLLTTSGTTALEMATLLCDLKDGDEVILPSYTFSSTATSIVLTGAKLVFVDIRPDTMNIDENKIESAITEKTKAIMVVHYAGVACEMDTIMEIAKRHNLKVIEDAAQAVMSTYKGKPLGTIGDFGCYSFHETKNYSMGEGGALVINNPEYNEKAEILREKGTNRTKFYRGQIDKYTWVDYGSSYLPSDLNAAYLWAQLELADEINNDRLDTWNYYYDNLKEYEQKGLIKLPHIPEKCEHNAHMFYLKFKKLEERTRFINYMRENDVHCVFHYIPLHSAPAGIRFGKFAGEDKYTTSESEKIVRLPMYYGLKRDKVEYICKIISDFYKNKE